METILVTGGAGFLGSWFVRHWLGHQDTAGLIVVLDKLTYAGNRASLASVTTDSRLVFRQGDIGAGSLVAALLAEYRPQAIVNFAAETHVDRSIDAPAPFVTTNVVGTWQLLEQTHNYWRSLPREERDTFRFLNVSTDEVFGPVDPPARSKENAPYRPSSPYAASKAAGDHMVRAYNRTYGLPVLVVHPSNNFGPFQFPEKLVPLVILNAIEELPLPLYGSGQQSRDWLFGEDLCRAIVMILQQGRVGESFNVASGVERTNESLMRQICEVVDRSAVDMQGPSADRIVHVADRPGHDTRYALDTEKIRSLGWTPQVDLTLGLEQTIGWYLDNRAWVAEVTENFDRARRIGTRQ